MKPIAVIGGGIAGLAAAATLHREYLPVLVIDAAEEPGGRCRSMRTEHWTADLGVTCFSLRDDAVMRLVRKAGLEAETVALQGAVCGLDESGAIQPRPSDFAGHRVTLKRGMQSLFDEYAKEIDFLPETTIGALRWRDQARRFQMRDVETGRALRHPESRRVIEASAVVLAVPGTSAADICGGSGFLQDVYEVLRRVEYDPGLTAVFELPRQESPFCLLECGGRDGLAHMTFEERQSPLRVGDRGMSVLVVQSTADKARDLHSAPDAEAAGALYGVARKVVPSLPEEPNVGHVVRWRDWEPHEESRVRLGEGGIPTNPPGLPVALAGDYVSGPSLNDWALSGERAARSVMQRLEHGV